MYNSHYFSPNQESKLLYTLNNVLLNGISLKILSSSGVFSSKKIDKGTLLLIKEMVIIPKWKILDIGCGTGIIGLYASKLSKSKPYLVDVNKRACMLAKMNAKSNKIKAFILNGNLYEPINDIKFDTILTNPPQSAGKEICFELISQAKQHLKKAGLLQLVARPKKGGNSLAAKMEQVFGNVEKVAKQSGYAVYVSKNL